MPNRKLNRKLMSVVDAAGYAMAPADDVYVMPADHQPEIAMRNGHQAAASTAPKVERKPSTLMLQIEAWIVWLRDVWLGGRAAA